MNKISNLACRQTGFKFQISNYNSGFTLLEILVASFIFVLVVLTSFIIFSNTIGTKARSEVYQKAQENLIMPLDILSRDIREADSFYINTNKCNGIWIEKTNKSTKAKEYLCYFKKEINNVGTLSLKTKNSISAIWGSDNDLTSSKSVDIEKFEIRGEFPSAEQTLQPYIMISMQLKTILGNRKEVDELTLDLNTTVTLNKINWKEE